MTHDGQKSITDEPKEIFGKFPAWYVKLGIWAELTPSEAKVLVVLSVLAHNMTHICMPSWKTLSKLSGVGFSAIGKTTKDLERRGLIRRWRNGYRVRYHLEFHAPEWVVATANWIVRPDTIPNGSESYSRDRKSGRFTPRRQESRLPGKSEPLTRGSSEPAKSLSQYEQ